MSYAAAIADTLRTAAMADYDTLKVRVADTAKAVVRLRAQTDIVLVMGAVNELSLCAEALAAAAEAFHKNADAALAASMEETGCYAVATEHHTVSLVNGVPRVDIVDSTAVPPEMMTNPQPTPDKRKIAALLKGNPAINWARFLPGKSHLQRRSNH